MQWVETAHYLGMTLVTQLTSSAHLKEVRKKESQRLCFLEYLFNRRSGLIVRNGVLLCKQVISCIMDYVCPIWRTAARSHLPETVSFTI
jgi:hypothetical protein